MRLDFEAEPLEQALVATADGRALLAAASQESSMRGADAQLVGGQEPRWQAGRGRLGRAGRARRRKRRAAWRSG